MFRYQNKTEYSVYCTNQTNIITYMQILQTYVVCLKSKCTDFPMDELVM